MNSMVAQARSVPDLLAAVVPELDRAARATAAWLGPGVRRLHLAGCGDSHHAAVSTELAFEAWAGLPAEPLTSLQLGRYTARHLAGDGSEAAVAVSVSGSAARTVEALALAGRHGARTVALTAAPSGRLAGVAEHVLLARAPEFADPEPYGTPGVRSYAVNQVALLLLAVALGEERGRLDAGEAAALRAGIGGLAGAAAATLDAADGPAAKLAGDWHDTPPGVVLGAGPQLGTALFGAAKLLEAAGDLVAGQDLEEWAHLQFYARRPHAPVVVVTDGARDASRAGEVVAAARAVGTPVAVVAAGRPDEPDLLPYAAGLPELLAPVVAALPLVLLAAYRAERLGETYFGTDRPLSASRIKTSEIEV